MAIIYSYPTVTPSLNDLVLGTDVDNTGKATRNFTVQSIIDLVTVTGNNLQDVLNNGNIAVGRDIILGTVQDPAQTIYAGTFSTGVASIVGGVGQNFTDFTSTRITGTLQTNAQPNITSLGTLTSLKVGNATPAITSIVTTLTAPGDDIKLATTKAIVDYIATTPNPETLAQTLVAGQVTGGRDIIVSAGDDVTFTDTSKIILGTGSDATIEHDGTDLKIVNTGGKTTISNSSGDIDISATAATKKLNLNGKTGVELQFDTGKRLETLLGGAKVTGAFEATGIGTLNGIVNTNSYTDSSGDTGTSGQILSSTGASGTNWIDDPNPTPYSWLVETDSGTGSPYTVVNGNQIHFKGDTNISTSWNNTNKEVLISLSGTSVTGTGAANQVTYWDGTQTITGAAGFTFAGGATGKVAIGGELEVGGVLTDGTFTGSSGTYTGYASISSTVFVGPLQGNADTATALAAAGTVSMSGDTVAAGVTYTSGGNVPLVSTISDSVVYNKELAGFNATSGSVADGDSIIEALEKLQGQITNLPQGLVYQGVWSAAGTGSGTPDLTQGSYKVNGHFYICDTAGSAAPNGAGTTPNDWDVRDWVIFADDGAGGGVDEWQKIDNSSLAGGTGTPNTMTKWLTNQTIGNSTITDNGSIVTIADTVDFTTQGNNTFGNTSADTTLMKGNTTLEENLILAKGLSLGSSYGSAGQVLTSGGGVNVANTWTTPTVGTVTGVTGLYGITVAGTSAVPTIAVTSDTNNLVHLATIKTNPVAADTILINDSENSDVLKQATISSILTLDPARSLAATLAVGNTSGANNILMADSQSVNFGAGNDLQITHNGTDSQINNFTGNLQFTQLQDDGDISFASDDGSGGDTIYFQLDGGQAQSRFLQDVKWDDDKKAKFGTSDDLRLYHNGTTNNSNIENYTGDLYFTQNTDDGDIIFRNDDGSGGVTEYLKIDGGAVETRFLKSTRHFDNVGAYFGDSADLQIYHDGSNSYIDDTGTGSLLIKTSALLVRNPSDASMLDAQSGGAINLYYNGSKKFETTSTGISVTGDGTITGIARANQLLWGNSYSQGVLSWDTGYALIQGQAGNGIKFRPNATTALILDTSGNAEFKGNVEIDGNLTVDGNIIHGSGGGTFNGNKAITSGASALAFTLTRAVTGTLVFDVWLTSGTSNLSSVAKKYTVAHSFNSTPVYNKIIDTGPNNTNDFTVTFANSNTGANGTSVTCSIISNVIAANNIGYTVQVGHESVRALTFTAG